jgi:uncharacterized repeat protein (TIGR01451 family)
MKKALILLPVLVAVGLLVALGVGALPVAQAQQPDATYTVFLPVICRDCDPTQPVSLVQVTQTLVQPANGVAQNGDPVIFQVTIKNNGGSDITQLPLDDIFDTRYLEYVNAFPTPDLVVGGTLQWRDLTTYMPRGFNRRLPPGQSFDVTVQFKVTGCPAGTPVTNQVLVSGALDANGNEIRLASKGTQLMIACLNLEVTTPPHRTQAYLGEVVEFVIVLRNSGNSPVITLPLEEDFDPTVFELVSATPPPTTADSATGRLVWSNLTADQPLAPGQRLTVTLRLRVAGCPSSGEVTNSAFVSGAVARVSCPGQGPIDFALPLATSDTTLSVPCAQLKLD